MEDMGLWRAASGATLICVRTPPAGSVSRGFGHMGIASRGMRGAMGDQLDGHRIDKTRARRHADVGRAMAQRMVTDKLLHILCDRALCSLNSKSFTNSPLLALPIAPSFV